MTPTLVVDASVALKWVLPQEDSDLAEGWRALKLPGGRHELAAYDWCLKASHAFNVLDARGAISVSQRAGMILAIRKLACAVAAAHVGAGADAPGEGARA